MPTYEYRCKSCGYEFEELQSIHDKSLTVCPKCAKPALKRLLSSGAGLVFKGSGFYQTDYKKSNSSTSASSKGTDTKKQGKKSEIKPETKTESKPAPDKSTNP
jgi:putative FmdB family regulatory protein